MDPCKVPLLSLKGPEGWVLMSVGTLQGKEPCPLKAAGLSETHCVLYVWALCSLVSGCVSASSVLVLVAGDRIVNKTTHPCFHGAESLLRKPDPEQMTMVVSVRWWVLHKVATALP